MKTFTHPDGATATVQPHSQGGVLVTYTNYGDIVPQAAIDSSQAEGWLLAAGFLDDQVENAARWCFFKKAAVEGSRERAVMDRLVDEYDENKGGAEDGYLAMEVLQDLIDTARKHLACP